MLPRLNLIKFFVSIFSPVAISAFLLTQTFVQAQVSSPSIEIINPPDKQEISKVITIQVLVSNPGIGKIHLGLFHPDYPPSNGAELVPCYWIAQNVSVPPTRLVEQTWDSASVFDNDFYSLGAWDAERVPPERDWNPVKIKNNQSGDPCKSPPPAPPSQPPSQPPPSQPPSQSQPPTPEIGDGTKTKSTMEASPPEKPGEVGIVTEEEIPITIGEFDPDIFLKGSNIKLKNIKTIKQKNKTILHFDGRTKPNTLVTLYIFTNPVIVTVKSGPDGLWYYDREKNLEAGKHIAFATIYDEGVTRRSNVVSFFIAKTATGSGSLIIKSSNFQRISSYLLASGGAILICLLIIILFRIYSQRRLAKI